MDIWQEQLATVITDKEFVKSMLEMMQSMPKGFGETEETYGTTETYAKTRNPASKRAAFSAEPDGDALHVLEQRLAAIEKRLAALEGDAPARAGGARKSSAKRGAATGRKTPRGNK